MVLRLGRLFCGAFRKRPDERRRLSHGRWRDRSVQRGAALARRRLLALQAARRNAALLLRAAAGDVKILFRLSFVMAGLVRAIHVLTAAKGRRGCPAQWHV